MYLAHHTHGRAHRDILVRQRLPILVFVVLLVVVGLQNILFFSGVSMPGFLNRGSTSSTPALIALDDHAEVTSDFDQQPITITLYNASSEEIETLIYSKRELGFSLDTVALAADADSYNYRESLVPFGSAIFDHTVDITNYITLDTQQLLRITSQIEAEHQVNTVNAAISFPPDGGNPSFTPSKTGISYGSQRLFETIRSAIYTRTNSVGVSPVTTQPDVNQAFLEDHVDRLGEIVASRVTFEANGTSSVMFGNNELLQAIQPDTNGNFGFDNQLLRAYLEKRLAPVFEQVATPEMNIAGTTYPAVTGVSINTPALLSAYESALLTGQERTIEVPLTETTAQPTAEGISGSEAHLQAAVSNIAKKYNAAVYVEELEAEKRSAGYTAHQPRIAASTYKLLVAYAVALDISEGKQTWDDRTYNRSVRACLDSMIVYSTNHCAENWVYNVYGTDYLNRLGASVGLLSSCFGCSDYAQSSVADQITLLKAFIHAEGLDRQVADVVVDMLQRQRWRSGIPYGLSYQTMNKIGWVPGHYNDTAVIYTDNGAVALSIYTNSNGWSQIREITAEVLSVL